MKIKEGMNPLNIFDDAFTDDSYCWRQKDILWLSLIWVKPDQQGKGVLTRLLEKVKTLDDIKMVLIPTPSTQVALTAAKHEFDPCKVNTIEGDMDAMGWGYSDNIIPKEKRE